MTVLQESEKLPSVPSSTLTDLEDNDEFLVRNPFVFPRALINVQ